MKILLVVPSFPKTSETFIVSKFLGLLERGYDVKVICGSSDPIEWKRFPTLDRVALKRRVLVTPRTSPRWQAALSFPVVFLRALASQPTATVRYLRRGRSLFGLGILKRLYLDAPFIIEQPELVHFEFGALAVGRTYLGKLLDCKILVSFRGYDISFVGLDDPQFYSEVWNEADAFHFRGTDLRTRALHRGCPPEKLFAIIPPGIDVDKFPSIERVFSCAGSIDRPLRLVSVGRIEWKKGYEYALQSVALLREQGLTVEYRILGAGSSMPAIRFCCHDLGLEKYVEFIGAVSPSEVRKYLAWADIFLHASVSEGFSNAVLEAQAMQLPVVTSDADGATENVVDGRTGFVVPRRNSQALATKIAILAYAPPLREQMGKAGRQHVVQNFQRDKELQAFAALYARLLDEHSA